MPLQKTKGYTTRYDVIFAIKNLAKEEFNIEIKEE